MQIESSFKIEVSNKIKKLMKEQRTSEEELSKATNISQSAVNRIKNGQVCPSFFQAYVISKYFNIKLDDLVSEVNENQENIISYHPIIDSTAFIKNQKKQIIGFHESNKSQQNKYLGFIFDSSFDCTIFNKGAIIIAQLIDSLDGIKEGSTLLFHKNNRFMVGNLSEKEIHRIDNLNDIYKIDNVKLIGVITKIETKYIKSKNIISKIIKQIDLSNIDKLLQDVKVYQG